jgi:hypothetical protein
MTAFLLHEGEALRVKMRTTSAELNRLGIHQSFTYKNFFNRLEVVFPFVFKV